MYHLPRLLKISGVIAKYRLDQIVAASTPVSALARGLVATAGVFWTGHACRKLNPQQRLRLALEELGPIYIKFGQLLSTRRDFLPAALADELQGLQDKVPPFASPGIRSLVEQALQKPWPEVFASLDENPLASASVAQVHAATLLSGEEVVVKVLRPGIGRIIAEDIRLLKWVAGLVEKHVHIGKRLRPIEVVADYEKVILGELNLLAEGANATQLRRNFEHSTQLYVPRVYWDYSREQMLVMERIYGIPVANIDQLNAAGINLKRLAETGVEIFFTQVFEHSFFHADMHPGNIFVAPEYPDSPRYIAIDCAIIGSLSKDDQQYLARNLLAIFQRDYRKVAELHVESGWVPAQTSVPEFEAAMRAVCEPVFEKPLKEISFGYLLVQLFRTAGRFNMEVQPSLVLLQKTLLNVEGLGRQLYPELDLWTTALPFLERWQSRRLQVSTVFNALKDNVPDWIEQFPHLPQLWLDSLAGQSQQQQQLAEMKQLLARQQKQLSKTRRRHRRQAIGLGLMALSAALLMAWPGSAEVLATVPVSSLILAAAGVYFLYFRR
ncbi:MAG: ubiquinone biosynthesis regulatory protein kinase UbiB [Pseudomonadales bacterium]|nr:ubiquinone biosynthesis regulatory protein kinase UbiB [Pseudomonadales bacterium]